MSPLNQIIRYKPVVSDVSDEELINSVEEMEKSENVVTLTPFDIFKTRSGCGCIRRKPKSAIIHKFNPIRSKEAMSELEKRGG